MATKKASKKPSKKPAPKKASAKKSTKPASRPGSIAIEMLHQLPPVDAIRRDAYQAAYTDEQCLAWGKETKAVDVLADAERAIDASRILLKRPVTLYALTRFAWLCHMSAELSDAILAQSTSADDVDNKRLGRDAAVTNAIKIRKRLFAGLTAIAGGNATLRQQIAERNDSSHAPHALETSITGLLQLAARANSNPHGMALAEDAGMGQAFLAFASAGVDALRRANQRIYGGGISGHDTDETNLIEGRVLRELSFMRQAYDHAKDLGELVPVMPPLRTLVHATSHDKAAAPTPPTAPATNPSPTATPAPPAPPAP